MNTITTATWRALLLYNGQPDKFIQHHKDQGYTAIFPKIGNGLTKWVGLSEYFKKAKDAGLESWAWWYLYGYAEEGLVIGRHADILGVEMLALDIESYWVKNAGWTQYQRDKAAMQLMFDIRDAGYTGKLALCSWWNLDSHPKTPFKILLDACDYNMPQQYWIGRHSALQATDLINQSLEMYEEITGFPTNKTMPVLASFGQEYGTNNTWWKTTITQMEAAQEAAELCGCMGSTFYSTDYLLGGAGHEYPKVKETAMLESIKRFTPVVIPPTPPAPPAPPAPPVTDKVIVQVRGKKDSYQVIQSEVV